jgi:uncharacterized protein (DUF433 family)
MAIAPTPRIETTPGVSGGAARVAGTRIPTWLLVYARRRGSTDAALLADYPSLTPADLDAVWDYYRANPVEVEQAIWEQTVAANYAPGEAVPAWVLVYARQLGLPDDRILAAFDHLTPADIDAAWREYRADPARIDRDIVRHRLAA